MKRFSKLAVAGAALSVIATAPMVFASSPGQLTGGSQVYEAKNITQGGSYSDTTNTACGDVVQYSVMLHNAGSGELTNIIVRADLAGGKVSATPAEGSTYGTFDTTTVNVPSGDSLDYQSGTTVLYNGTGGVIKNLPDGITASGVGIGDMAGSTLEYVNFQAKISCPTTPPTTPPSTPAPKVLPNTGAGDVAEMFVGTSAFGTIGHFIFSRRKRQ